MKSIKDISQLKIGYVPTTQSLEAIADRGRFCNYAKKKGIKFEIADPNETYDLVVVTAGGDISVWSKYQKGNAKIIYDQVDSYLAIPDFDIKGALRGLAKFFSGQHRSLQLSYKKAIQNMSKRADAVSCASEVQKKDFILHNKNVHVILDVHNDLTQNIKKDYTAKKPFNLVWEGLPVTLHHFFEIRDVLKSVNSQQEICLHIVTNLEYYQYLRKYGKRNTIDMCRKIFDHVYLYDWNIQLASTIICACDMAIIPISPNDSFAMGKPSNKLLLFWKMGMPTITTATPAYVHAMDQANLDMACQTKSEWSEKLLKYMNDETARRGAGEKGKAYTDSFFSDENAIAQWDNLIQSVFE
ncbi:MAG: hypothetical protein HN472_00940 [Nitrospina sp.]|jgi:glycosyltransferase involved in cell wall biosynthesis|nr:hypothetical protein [Nitrospina sp.]MBT3508092.1 hypothetical protein [Nitrospina sp.]MBT3875711.1 hypothetical protein [Nitrospina sp.]MBT4049638.1 hypothetical protein [Nitrospina sp.]MBT4558350.1 hypothetical protein [Nitrospina sp.]